MRSASKDPFASTSQALGRARERRTQRTSTSGGRRGLEEDEDEDHPPQPTEQRHRRSSSSKHRHTESSGSDAAIPSRTSQNKGTPSRPSSKSSEPTSSTTPSRQHRKLGSGSNHNDEGSQPLQTTPHRGGVSTNITRPKKSKSLTSGADHGGSMDSLPSTFRTNPKQADPILFYLPRLISSEEKDDESLLDLKSLLQAAEDDVRLHRGRVQAGLKKGKTHYCER